MTFRDNPARSRFEYDIDGRIVFADYRARDERRIVIDYVEAPPELRGTGAASRLMEAIMTHARERGLTIEPRCSYAAAWMRKHREHHDLLAG